MNLEYCLNYPPALTYATQVSDIVADFIVIHDDMKVKFAGIIGDDKDRNRILCEVAKYPFPRYDFAPYANGLIKEKGIKCD